MTHRVVRLGPARRCAAWLILCAALTPIVSARAAPPVFDEYQVKAAFLFNVARFVEWPADAFASPTSPVTFCVVGADPFGGTLDEALRGRQVSGRTPVVKRLRAISPASGCHVVFLAAGDAGQATALADLGAASVLTVADSPGFASRGGIVSLFLDDQRVRFEVNTEAAERARLHISSRVLALASAVYRRRTP